MIVGTKKIDITELAKHCYTETELEEYVNSLVPTFLRHNLSIVNNQRYLVALYVRRLTSFSFDKRKRLCNKLVEGITIRGTVDSVIDFSDLLSKSDVDTIFKHIFKEEL